MEKSEKEQGFGASVCMKFIERFGTQLVTIVLNVILARLLSPDDYGVLAILNVFIVLAQVITQYGINNALVQKQDISNVDYSTGLLLSMLISVLLYLVLYIISPFIASFYRNPNITLYLRVLSVSVFFVSFNAVYLAILMKKMQFRKIMIIGIASSISAGIVGVVLAYVGFGVWSLIIQQILSSFLQSVLLVIWVKWKYALHFSRTSASFILKYGGTISVAAIIDNLYYDVESLFVGKWFSQNLLGYYTNARTYPLRVISSVKDTISGVVFPAMSKVAGNVAEVKKLAKLSIRLFSFVVFPAMIGLALIAEEFVLILLTEKWLPIVFPMQMFCLAFAFLSISSPNIQVIKSLGKAKMNLIIEIVRKAMILCTLILVVLVFNTIDAVAIGFAISNIITAIGVAAVCGHQIGYELIEQFRDMLKNIVSLIIMILAITLIHIILPSDCLGLMSMILKIIVGGVIYISSAFLLKNPIITMVMEKLGKKGMVKQ